MNKHLIKDISEIFGSSITTPNAKVGSEIIYKGKKYKIQQSGVKIPNTKDEFEKFKSFLKPIENLLRDEKYQFDSHHEIEGSPYAECGDSLFQLYDNSRNGLREFINSLKRKTNSARLELDDFIAFYRPFHFYPDSWGIYLNIEKLAMQAKRIEDFNLFPSSPTKWIPELSSMDCCLLSFFKTYFHEVYHHKIEMMATKFEIILRKKIYVDGFNKFYCNTFGTDFCLEEAFANVYGLNKSLTFLDKKDFVTHKYSKLNYLIRNSLLKDSPRGYRVSYELTELEQAEQYDFENQFIEILFDYAFQSIYNERPYEMNSELWKLFTYKLDPIFNIDNEVTFIIPA